MANEFFQASSIPQTNSQGSSAAIRGEFSRIALAFDKMPAMAGKPNKLVKINASGTALQDSSLVEDQVVTLTGTQTISNKTFSWSGNTWSGFGTGATKTAGTGADNVLLLSVAGQLPAIDGSLLTGMNLSQFSGVLAVAHGGTGASDAATARTNLGLGSISTQNANAVAITGGSIAGITDLAVADGGTGASDAAGARTNLGLGSISTQNANAVAITGGSIAGITDLAVADGGTGASDATGARANLSAAKSGANSDITSLSGLTTPLSIAQGGTGGGTLSAAQAALGIDLKANANNAVLTGAPVAPSPAAGDNSQRIATTYYVNQLVAAIGGATPSNTAPLMNGVASAGTAVQVSRDDHVHPVDTSRAAAGANTDITSISGLTTALSVGQGGTGSTTAAGARTNLGLVIGTDVLAPAGVKSVGGASLIGSGNVTALSGLVLTGATLNASPAQNDNSLKIASTAYVDTAIAQSPVGMLPSTDLPLVDGVASAGTSVTGSRSDHVHPIITAFNGTVGATTPSTGAFTTLSASGSASVNTSGADAVFLANNGTSSARFAVDSDGPYIYALTSGDKALRVFAPNGANVLSADNTGLSVTGALSASGWVTTASGLNVLSGANDHRISLAGNTLSIQGDFGNTGGDIRFYTNGANERGRFNSTGLSVTGAISASAGPTTLSGTTAFAYKVQNTGATAYNGLWFQGQNATDSFFGRKAGSDNLIISGANQTSATWAEFSPTGLAVTGALSASGDVIQGAGAVSHLLSSGSIAYMQRSNAVGGEFVVGDSAGVGKVAFGRLASQSKSYVYSADPTLVLGAGSAETVAISSTGLSVTGALSASGSITTTSGLFVSGNAGTYRSQYFQTTGGLNRWVLGTENTAESGSNAGSDFFLDSKTDAGGGLRRDLLINRATGGWGIAGSVGIGGAPTTGINLDVMKATTGAAAAYAASFRINPDSTVSTAATGVSTYAISSASSTTPSIRHFVANQGAFSGTHTNQYGFLAEASLTGATNNYGFYSNIAAGTGRWNFFAGGTAKNIFAGQTSIGGLEGSESLRVLSVASAVNYLSVYGHTTGNTPGIVAAGSDVNIPMAFTSKGTGAISLATGGGAQFVVSNTANAVNYVQAFGGATTNGVAISAQGADANVELNLWSKGSFPVTFCTGGTYMPQFKVGHTASAVNYLQAAGGATSYAPVLSAQGSDTNIALAFNSKGTYGHTFTTGGSAYAPQFTIAHAASSVNYVNVTGAVTGLAPTLSVQGSDTNVGLVLSSKGTGGISFYTNNSNDRQMRIISTAGAVNFVDVTGAATGSAPTISASGSDTNIDIKLTPKGTGSVVVNNGLLGYGTGAGGTVTQLTSKSQSVTINKASGQIVMSNAALTSGTTVEFVVNNSTVAVSDIPMVVVDSASANYASYLVQAYSGSAAGTFVIRVKNQGGSTLSDAVKINFAIIKGATA